MVQELRDMRIRQVSLVDKGATGRSFALLKRDAGAVRKVGPATFAERQAVAELGPWMSDATYSLGDVIWAAIAGDPNDPTVTPELRLQAVRVSVEQFSAQLLERVAAAIVGQAPAAGAADVAKRRDPGSWRGLM